MSKTHDFEATVRWTGNTGKGTANYRSYTRDWSLQSPGKPAIACSNDPLLGGNPALYNPEDMLITALSSCHMLWFLRKRNFPTNHEQVKDLSSIKSLYWIDRYDMVFPVLYGLFLYLLGSWVAVSYPSLGTSGGQFLVWGYFLSTVMLAHVTFSINSIAHLIGKRDYQTKDNSRNNFILAILTLGEGWHNNHHCAPGSVRQGFKSWQVDISYYLLRCMECCGLIWDVKYPNQQLLDKKLIKVKS